MKSVLLVGTFLLGAVGCGPEGLLLGEQPTLSGRIEGLGPEDSQVVVLPLLGDATLATGSVGADGAFRVQLPARDAIAPSLRELALMPYPACTSLPKVEPAGLPIAVVHLATRDASGKGGSTLVATNRPSPRGDRRPGDTEVSLLYADQDGTLEGVYDCSHGLAHETSRYTVALHKGWNFYSTTITELTVDASGSRVAVENSAGPLPPDVKWYLQ